MQRHSHGVQVNLISPFLVIGHLRTHETRCIAFSSECNLTADCSVVYCATKINQPNALKHFRLNEKSEIKKSEIRNLKKGLPWDFPLRNGSSNDRISSSIILSGLKSP